MEKVSGHSINSRLGEMLMMDKAESGNVLDRKILYACMWTVHILVNHDVLF